jgi:transposase
MLQLVTGVVVHDGCEAYRAFTAVTQGLCNSHHLREWQKICEDTLELLRVKQMVGSLFGTRRQVQGAKAPGGTGLGKEALNAVWSDYQMILTADETQSSARVHTKTGGRIAQAEPRRLLNRWRTHQGDVSCFAADYTAPLGNNWAERDIRRFKLLQKVSGCVRSTVGAERFVTTRWVMSAARKQAVN